MSRRRPSASGRSLGLSSATFAAIFIALFLIRTVLYANLPDATSESCHTGGIAVEILDHGLRLPLRAYTPEMYEIGIVIEGFLAAPLFALLGPNLLAIKLLATLFATVAACAGLALVPRLLDAREITDVRVRRSVVAGYLLLTALAPRVFTLKMLDGLGDHNEGTALAIVLLLLLVRRIEVPASRGRFVALWLACGLAAFWEKGTFMAVAVAAAYEILALRKGLSSPRVLSTAAALFAVGYTPGIITHVATRFHDVFDVAEKFAHRGSLPRTLSALVQGAGTSAPYLLLLFVAAPALWMWTGWHKRAADAPVAYLSAYVALHLALALKAPAAPGFYFLYGFPLWAIGAAALVAEAGARIATRSHLSLNVALASMMFVVGLLAAPHLTFDTRHVLRLLHDQDRAACSWRFGRAFTLTMPGPGDAVAACRALGGDRAYECISGLPFGAQGAVGYLSNGRERRAYAFGVGRVSLLHGGRGGACEKLPDATMQAACMTGRRWECLSLANLLARVSLGQSLRRPTCPLNVRGLGRFPHAIVEAWLSSKGNARPDLLVNDPACTPIWHECLGSRLASQPRY